MLRTRISVVLATLAFVAISTSNVGADIANPKLFMTTERTDEIVGMQPTKNIKTTKRSSSVMPLAEANKAVIRRNLEEIWHTGRLNIADEIVAKNYVRHLPGGVEIKGREAYKEYVKGFMTTFPDTRWEMEMVVCEEDCVVVRYHGHGTHMGPGMGDPTGREFDITATVIHRIANGKMAECWVDLDNLDFQRQLGLLPPAA
jgi:predicted ester cyclase